MNLLDIPATTLRNEIAAGRVSAVEVCRASLDRIARINTSLNAFNLVAADRALARAQEVDTRRAAGESPGPLAGVPIAIKDNINVRGMLTTASSRILRDFIPPYDATVVRRLESAGAVIVA
jgi:aspartyl-tRNA(Asn)/glutamyl-tRNA(Gln) amidotransferase subunit A